MSDEEHLDIDPCDKDEPGESKVAAKVVKKAADAKEKRFKAALAEKAAKEAAKKEIDSILAVMSPDQKGRMLAAMSVTATPGLSLPRVRYDHDATTKRLIANTAPALVLMETLKDDYESVHYMGALCDYWKSLITQDRLQINEHAAFKKHFRTVRHLYGLPVWGVSDALGDLSMNEDEGAGAD